MMSRLIKGTGISMKRPGEESGACQIGSKPSEFNGLFAEVSTIRKNQCWSAAGTVTRNEVTRKRDPDRELSYSGGYLDVMAQQVRFLPDQI
jgi:hypothetical protein